MESQAVDTLTSEQTSIGPIPQESDLGVTAHSYDVHDPTGQDDDDWGGPIDVVDDDPTNEEVPDYDLEEFAKTQERLQSSYHQFMEKRHAPESSNDRDHDQGDTTPVQYDVDVSEHGDHQDEPSSPLASALDVMSETNRNTEQLGMIAEKLDIALRQLDMFNTRMNVIEEKLSEQSIKADSDRDMYSKLKLSFTAYQTNTADAIAAVERRVALKQANVDAKAAANMIPTSLEHDVSINEIATGGQSKPLSPSDVKVADDDDGPIDLSGWANL